MDVPLAQLLILVLLVAPVGTAVVPPVLMAINRRVPRVAGVLYVVALGCLVAWVVASNEHMEWADRTGGTGSIWAGGHWLLIAGLAATLSARMTLRDQGATSGAGTGA